MWNLGLLGAAGGAIVIPDGAYHLISSQELDSPQSSITFNVANLTDVYKHLQLRISGRSDRASTEEFMYVRYNGDSGANYTGHYLIGTGTTYVGGTNHTTYPNGAMAGAGAVAANSPSDIFGNVIWDILDPFDNSKFTTAAVMETFINVNYNRVAVEGNAWLNTDTVTSITIVPVFATNWAAGSRFGLYGLRSV